VTIINYKINNQTARDLKSSDWESAKTLQAQTQAEEIAQFNWWNIIALVTNNDGTLTMCPIDSNGNPLEFDENGNQVIYVDKTVAPEV
jgi:hypothetical protein